jgi:hypothetical protein
MPFPNSALTHQSIWRNIAHFRLSQHLCQNLCSLSQLRYFQVYHLLNVDNPVG